MLSTHAKIAVMAVLVVALAMALVVALAMALVALAIALVAVLGCHRGAETQHQGLLHQKNCKRSSRKSVD